MARQTVTTTRKTVTIRPKSTSSIKSSAKKATSKTSKTKKK